MVPASPPGKQITPTTWYRQLNKGALKKWRQVSFYRGYQTSLGYAVTRSRLLPGNGLLQRLCLLYPFSTLYVLQAEPAGQCVPRQEPEGVLKLECVQYWLYSSIRFIEPEVVSY